MLLALTFAAAALAPSEPEDGAESWAVVLPTNTEEDTSDDTRASRPWTVLAFVDTGYAFNSNRPDNHIYRGTSTHPRTDEFTVNLGLAALTHAPTPKQPYRLELGLQAGSAADALVAAEPVPGGDDGRFAGSETWKHLALANAGGRIERSGTEIGAGLFSSPIGIGGFWTPFNANVSPTWESNAAPFYLAGARVMQDLPKGFGLQAWVINGWQTIGDANGAPSYLAGATWARDDLRSGAWNANAFVFFGPEGDDLSADAWRTHADANVGWRGERLGVAAVWDYGQETRTDLAGSPVHAWSGGGLFIDGVAYDGKSVDVELAARPDAWYERGDRIYGVDQWLLSGTATAGVFLWDHLRVRVEYRYDRSTADAGFFYRGASTSDTSPTLASEQHTIFLNAAGVLQHSFGLGK
ncbi:MAG: outer membrane beta-barrel protein [Nannocystaceae bacterium]|nr:porin [bacterium]